VSHFGCHFGTKCGRNVPWSGAYVFSFQRICLVVLVSKCGRKVPWSGAYMLVYASKEHYMINSIPHALF
jgi:hypothetical protein